MCNLIDEETGKWASVFWLLTLLLLFIYPIGDRWGIPFLRLAILQWLDAVSGGVDGLKLWMFFPIPMLLLESSDSITRFFLPFSNPLDAPAIFISFPKTHIKSKVLSDNDYENWERAAIRMYKTNLTHIKSFVLFLDKTKQEKLMLGNVRWNCKRINQIWRWPISKSFHLFTQKRQWNGKRSLKCVYPIPKFLPFDFNTNEKG